MTQKIDFDTAVSQAKAIAQRQDNNFLRLGEIGANVKRTYGAKTLNKLASASGKRALSGLLCCNIS